MLKNLKLFIVATFLLTISFANTALAGQIHLHAEFRLFSNANTPTEDQLSSHDWVYTTDTAGTPVFVLERYIDTDQLPFESRLGDAYLSINKSGVVSMGLSHAQKFGETQSAFHIPQFGGQLLPSEVPYVMQGVGGDYATGAWYFAGRVVIVIN